MIHQNLTPFHYGPKVTSRNPPQCELTIAVRGVFGITPGEPLVPIEDPVKQGFMTGDVYAEEDVDYVGEVLYASDFADWKPCTDILVKGTCHTPGGVPMAECPVRVSITGQWEKTLIAVGDRIWKPGLIGSTLGPPTPFTQMPLGYTRAYGGDGWARNPVGKGHGDSLEAPNIEHPLQRIKSRRDQPDPAGFGPVNPQWPQRAGKRGRNYGKSYRRERAPWYADDFDWTYFNAAPSDQQLQGYLDCTEQFVFQNLHPEHEVLTVDLPKLRLRVFAKDGNDEIHEVEMVLDTVTADLDEMRMYLGWRGLVDCEEDDYSDMKVVFIASEPLDEEPKSKPHYEQLLEEYEDDPIGLKKHTPEGFLEASKALEEAEASGADVSEIVNNVAPDGQGNPVSDYLAQQFGSYGAAEQKAVGEMLNRAAASWSSPQGIGFNEVLAKAVAEGAAAPPMGPPPLLPGGMPHIKLDKVMDMAGKMKGNLVASGYEGEGLQKLDAFINDPALKQVDPGMKPPVEEPMADFGKVMGDGAPAPPEKKPEPPPAPEEEKPPPGTKRDLSGKDFTDQDVRHEDFSNCDLSGANFTKADVRGVAFTGANLEFATFYMANADGCDFTDAHCKLAVFDKARLEEAVFRNANLDNAGFHKAKLPGAVLTGATAPMARFMEADLAGVDGRKMNGATAMFDNASMEGADFREADLTKTSFRAVKAGGIRLDGAIVEKFCAAMNAEFTGASCVDIKGDKSIWEDADLTDVDFSYAALERAFFSRAKLLRASFYCSNAPDSHFRKAKLHGTRFNQANLLKAELPKCECLRTDFSHANIWRTVFLDAQLIECIWTGTSLRHAILNNDQ